MRFPGILGFPCDMLSLLDSDLKFATEKSDVHVRGGIRLSEVQEARRSPELVLGYTRWRTAFPNSVA
jgi:hypothetical protein